MITRSGADRYPFGGFGYLFPQCRNIWGEATRSLMAANDKSIMGNQLRALYSPGAVRMETVLYRFSLLWPQRGAEPICFMARRKSCVRGIGF